MSTRAIIGISCTENSIRYIQIGHDGYPEHTGDTLRNCYDTLEKIDKLLSLGNLSNIGSTVRKCVLYHEPENKLDFTSGQLTDAFKHLRDKERVDYGYLFMDNKWKCWGAKGEEIDMDEVLAPNPLGEAQGLIKYVLTQAEVMKQEASDVHYSYKNADYQLGVHLQNIQCACRDIDSLLEESKSNQGGMRV
jgi:hypothetical protein